MKPLVLGAVPAHAYIMADMGTNTMRSILALGLLIVTSCADAATAHRFKPHRGHLHLGQRVPVSQGYDSQGYDPPQPAAAAKSFAVPGWTEEETLKWLHDGSAGSGKF